MDWAPSSRTLLFTVASRDELLLSFLLDYNYEVCLRLLPFSQQREIFNAPDPKRKLVIALFTHLVLNHVSGNEPWAPLSIGYSDFGKPFVEGGFSFNLSRSNDLVCIAVSLDGEVGVDLSHELQEGISNKHFMKQMGEIFTPREKEQIEKASEPYHRFNHFWTLKEAFTKFVGCGLNVDLSTFSFEGELSLNETHSVKGPFTLSWRPMHIDYSNFELPVSGVPHCQSAVLKTGNHLPVFVSVITETSGPIECFNVDMVEILKRFVS